MKISYTSGSRYTELPPRRRRGKSNHLDVIATFVVTFILIGGVIYWFVYSKATKVEPVPTPVVVPLPKELIERPFNAADGLKQCEKLTPSLATQADKNKRAKCYAAVMTVFGTTDICTAATLDATSAGLCAAAQVSYEQTHPLAPIGAGPRNPTNTNGSSAIETILNRNTNTNSLAGGTSGSTGAPKPGTTPKPGTQPGTSPTGTSTTSVPPPTTPTQPDIDPSTPPGETTPNPPPVGSTTTALELCIIDPGQLVLLQHTNECQ